MACTDYISSEDYNDQSTEMHHARGFLVRSLGGLDSNVQSRHTGPETKCNKRVGRCQHMTSLSPYATSYVLQLASRLSTCLLASGVASVVLPAVKILDAIYSTRITLEGLALQHGMKHEDWPEAVLESLKARHNHIYSQIEDQICSLGSAYHPLGATQSLTVQTQDMPQHNQVQDKLA